MMTWPWRTNATYKALVALGGAEREPMDENRMYIRNMLVGTLGVVAVLGGITWAVAFYNIHTNATVRDTTLAAMKAGYVQRVLPGSPVPVWTQAECVR